MSPVRPDRRELLRLLAAGGVLGPAGIAGWISDALAAGLARGTGVIRAEGTVLVNGNPAKPGTPVRSSDKVTTGRGSQAVIVVSQDAFLLRANTAVELSGRDAVLSKVAIAGGKVLAVFGKKPLAVEAGVAAIGIRGTGAYFEVEPRRVYFCLCYGEAVIEGRGMAAKNVKTTHHESPLYLLDDGTTLRAEPGPFLNHKDEELVMLEALVGREPPFTSSGTYPSGRY